MIIIAIEYLGDLLEKLAITARVFDEARQNGCYVFKFSVQLICIWGGDGRSGGRSGGRKGNFASFLIVDFVVAVVVVVFGFKFTSLDWWNSPPARATCRQRRH